MSLTLERSNKWVRISFAKFVGVRFTTQSQQRRTDAILASIVGKRKNCVLKRKTFAGVLPLKSKYFA